MDTDKGRRIDPQIAQICADSKDQYCNLRKSAESADLLLFLICVHLCPSVAKLHFSNCNIRLLHRDNPGGGLGDVFSDVLCAGEVVEGQAPLREDGHSEEP